MTHNSSPIREQTTSEPFEEEAWVLAVVWKPSADTSRKRHTEPRRLGASSVERNPGGHKGAPSKKCCVSYILIGKEVDVG